jgi:hypothetical protein
MPDLSSRGTSRFSDIACCRLQGHREPVGVFAAEGPLNGQAGDEGRRLCCGVFPGKFDNGFLRHPADFRRPGRAFRLPIETACDVSDQIVEANRVAFDEFARKTAFFHDHIEHRRQHGGVSAG